MAGRERDSRRRDGRLVFKLDSGSSGHLVNDADVFSTLKKLKKTSPVIMNVAKDGETLELTHLLSALGTHGGAEGRIERFPFWAIASHRLDLWPGQISVDLLGFVNEAAPP